MTPLTGHVIRPVPTLGELGVEGLATLLGWDLGCGCTGFALLGGCSGRSTRRSGGRAMPRELGWSRGATRAATTATMVSSGLPPGTMITWPVFSLLLAARWLGV